MAGTKEVIFLEGLEANLPTTGIIDGAIYVCTDSGKTYLGTSSTTMVPLNIVEASTNNGKIKINGTDVNVYTHPGSGTNPHGTTKSDVGLGNVGNFKAVSTVANQGLTDTEKSNARANIGAGTSNLTIGTTSTTAAAGNHTHTTSIATSTGTSQITLQAGGKYSITAGGTTYVFTMPSDNNTNQTVKGAGTAFGANDAIDIVAGSNVTVTPDTTNKKITIAATDTTYSEATTSAAGLMSASDKTKLNGIATGAEVNQNAFSNVKVGTTTVAADAKTDTLELVAGNNITLTPDATNDKITIASSYTDTNQTVKVGSSTFGANAAVAIAAGSNVTVTPDTTNNTITIASSYTDTNQKVKAGSTTFGNNDVVEIKAGTNVTVTPDSTNKTITIASSYTDTNQKVKAGSTTFGNNDVVEIAAGTNVTVTPDSTNKKITIAATDTTYESKAAASGGTDVSLVTTGEKYTWNSKAAGNHTHTLSLASGGTSTVNLAANTAYTLTAGGSTLVFKTPADGNTDAKQKITTATTTKAYITGVTATNYSSGTAYEGLADTGVYLTTTAGELAASNFVGKHSGYTLGDACAKGVSSTGTTDTSALTTLDKVNTLIAALPEPMVFKGSLGTGGTITTLPTASASNEGFTYKVITAGTYASQTAKVGDTFISDGSAWVLIPSGDEPSGTVTSITLKATSPIAINSTAAITTSGTRTLSHANSGVTAGTYRSVTVNATGHVTAGTNPTTLAGYGITDAKIASGVITLGSNTITPLTSSSTLNAAKLSGEIPTTVTQTEWDAAYTHSTSTHARTDATAVAASETNGNIIIDGTETTVYTHPTTAGNKHIPSGGSSGQFLGYDSAGTAKWVSNPNTNQTVKVGSTTFGANDAIAITAGSNVTVTPDSTNKKITIAATDTTYTVGTTTVPNVTSVGSVPTLGTAIPADDITSWTTNTPTAISASVNASNACLEITYSAGTAASLSYTAKSIPNVTNVGSTPTLGTAITVVNSVTAN